MTLAEKVKYHVNHHWQSYILIPNLLWGNLYIAGGDDARLYYLYPLEYLKNFLFNVMSGNTLGGNLGYMPVSYSAPNIVSIFLLKSLLPFANTQLVTYGIIFSLGFLFFYLFLQEWISKKTPFLFVSSVVASFFYIGSPYITKTYFQSQFISIFILMVLPGFLWLFIAGVKRKQSSLVVASSLLYSVFSATVYSFPWFLPVILTLIPFFIYFAIRYGRYFWKMMIVFIAVTLGCNMYWIIHYIIPLVYKTNGTDYTATLLSDSFVQQNNNLVSPLIYLNSPVNQMINYIRVSWQDRQGVTVQETIGVVYLFIILVAGIFLRKVSKNTRILYLTVSSGLLLAILFFTPNLGLWNQQLFQFLVAHVPFFVIFRNMYDKFALAMAFYFAFVLFISFVILTESKIKRVYMYAAVIIALFVTIIRFIPYIHPDYKETGYSTRISGLNRDYTDLTTYIQNLHTSSRFVWYPMTFGGYVYLSDGNNTNHYYIGVSPLQIFSKASDLAGFYGLQTPGDPQLHWHVLALLQQKKYTEIGNILQNQNVGYVIVNNEQMPPNGQFILEQFDFVKSQTEEYKQTILGEKIRDFGKRYSLYSIHKNFRLPTVYVSYITGNKDTSATNIEFRRTPDGAYDIGPFSLSVPTQLVLMEPYSRLWSIERLDGYKHSTIPQNTMLANGYGNFWNLDPASVNTPTIHVRVEFRPDKFIVPSLHG
jgi:hypothetical protein